MDLSLSNILNVSVSQAPQGLGNYNTSNIGLFTRDEAAASFGTLGYKIYLDPVDVGTDFGTNSNTFKMAVAIFSQKPNILQGNGYLVVIPFLAGAQTAVQNINFPLVPASGAFVLNHGADATSSIAWNATAATIQADLRALTGLSSVVVSGSIASQNLIVTFTGVSGAVTTLTVTSDTLADANSAAITPVVTTTTIGSTAETLDAAIVRTQGLVQYFGVMASEIEIQTVMLAAAAIIQSLNKIAFFVSRTAADVAPGGLLDLLRSGDLNQSRGLYYGGADDTSALVFMASYASRGLSVNFSGSNTTLTMNLKDLAGVQPDPSMTQTLYNECKTAGVDIYVSFQGVAKVASFGANAFYDQIYNQQWLAGALQVAGFNYLAEVATKVPQTEDGMTAFKGAFRKVMQQSVVNQYCAAGTWNSPSTFGILSDFLANVSQIGYYIYSTPVSQQNQPDRAARIAPLVQIALKEAGAIHSGSVIVNINP